MELRRFIWIVLSACLTVIAVFLWLANTNRSTGRAITDELSPLLGTYGTPLYSSHEEELIVRDFFHDRRDGIFLDVGAGHYRDRSNTYYLEQHLGWSGIAIDAQAKFAADYKTHRPRTRYFALFVSDRSNERARLFIGQTDLFSSFDRRFTEGYVPITGVENVPTITLNDLLTTQGIDRIDFVSMDIELAEPKALAGFDIARYHPQLVGIEAHPEVRQPILNYFQAHDYILVGKYLRADPQNLWFAPVGAPLPEPIRGPRLD
jgi:FkbM family methyltransferase